MPRTRRKRWRRSSSSRPSRNGSFPAQRPSSTTLDHHEKSLRQARRGTRTYKPSLGILRQELDRIDEEYADDTEYDEATSDAVDAASLLFSEPTAQELALLTQMRQWAEKASAQLDAKVKCLIDWLNTYIRPGKQWSQRTGHHLHRIPGDTKLAHGNSRPARIHRR